MAIGSMREKARVATAHPVAMAYLDRESRAAPRLPTAAERRDVTNRI